MSVSYSVLVALLSFAFLWVLGLAVLCVTERNNQTQDSRMLLLSPVVGLALISIIVTFATLANLLSDLYAKALGVALSLLALFVLAVQFRDYSVPNLRRNVWITPAITFLIAAVMGFLPLILGGWQYAILRGNGSDTFNYVAVANAFKEYPIDWILGASKQQLAVVSPTLSLVQELLAARWTTSAVLAFFSSFFNIPPIGFEYVYTVMLYMVASFTLAAALVMVGLRQSFAVALALAFCFGFWGQLVLDLRAFSHIAALPVLVAIIGQLIARPIGTDASSLHVMDWKINAILVAAVVFQYPEIVLAFLPGLFILLALGLNQGGRWRPPSAETVGYFTRLGVGGALLLSPLLAHLFTFTQSQASFAMQKTLGWKTAYFGWLKDPIRGIWGLAVPPGIGHFLDNGYSAVGFVIAVLLDIIIARRISHLVRYKNRPWFWVEVGIASMVGTGVAGAAFLISVGNPWAAGKLATYFSILIPLWLGIILAEEFASTEQNLSYKGKIERNLTAAVLVAWITLNLFFAAARIVHAKNGTDYAGYIMHHGGYRRVNAAIFSGKLISSCPVGATVAVIDPRHGAREFKVHLLEGLGYKVKLPGVGVIRTSELPDKLSSLSAISCVLVGDGRFSTVGQEKTTPSIIPLSSSLAGVISINGEYGLEFDASGGYVYLWNSGRSVEIKLFSDRDREINLEFELCPGRVRTEANPIVVYFGDNQKSVKVTQCTSVTLPQRVPSGVSSLNMSVEDSDRTPTIIGMDTRDLKLLVKVLGFK
ncbi:MAG TPA: hypothetical protein VHE58_07290 [Burkholderiales bacterium]|nr:hypothetical protein [Burkholderiales bacterium]